MRRVPAPALLRVYIDGADLRAEQVRVRDSDRSLAAVWILSLRARSDSYVECRVEVCTRPPTLNINIAQNAGISALLLSNREIRRSLNGDVSSVPDVQPRILASPIRRRGGGVEQCPDMYRLTRHAVDRDTVVAPPARPYPQLNARNTSGQHRKGDAVCDSRSRITNSGCVGLRRRNRLKVLVKRTGITINNITR